MRRYILPLLPVLFSTPVWADSGVATATDGTGTVGHVSCATQDGEPFRDCPFETTNKEDGSMTLRVFIGNGEARLFYIEDGEITGTNSLGDLGYKRGPAKTFAHITPTERFEFPNEVLDGQ